MTNWKIYFKAQNTAQVRDSGARLYGGFCDGNVQEAISILKYNLDKIGSAGYIFSSVLQNADVVVAFMLMAVSL